MWEIRYLIQLSKPEPLFRWKSQHRTTNKSSQWLGRQKMDLNQTTLDRRGFPAPVSTAWIKEEIHNSGVNNPRHFLVNMTRRKVFFIAMLPIKYWTWTIQKRLSQQRSEEQKNTTKCGICGYIYNLNILIEINIDFENVLLSCYSLQTEQPLD